MIIEANERLVARAVDQVINSGDLDTIDHLFQVVPGEFAAGPGNVGNPGAEPRIEVGEGLWNQVVAGGVPG